jgi:hypothetical protein
MHHERKQGLADSMSVIDLNPDPRIGKRAIIVRLGGETLGIYGTLEQVEHTSLYPRTSPLS